MKTNLDNQIKKIVNQLVNQYGASKVVLFGSTVWGDKDKANDLDFLVIKSGLEEQGRLEKIYSFIQKEVAADFLVYTPKEYAWLLKKGEPMIKLIEEKGKVLYG